MHNNLFILLSFILFILVNGLTAKSYDVRVLANDINTTNNIVYAKGNVILFSDEFILTCNRAIYDKDNQIVEAFENVNLLKGSKNQLHTNYAKIDFKQKNSGFLDFFISDSESNLWLDCNKAKYKDDVYIIKNSVVSSCDIKDPDWRFEFKKGEYNDKSKFVSLRDAIFYLGDTPLLYLPYINFSTIRQRKSGLLRPRFGYDDDEGLLYAQPYFYAPNDSIDFVFTPQIRTGRGIGFYIDTKFVDSLYSSGEIKGGGFYDFDNYNEENELENQLHWGIEFTYDRDRLLSQYLNGDWTDGLYIDLIYLNDIDYLNMQTNSRDYNDRMITSKFNYFLQNDYNYFGLYAKYFIDTQKLNNDDTLQKLPTIQYHRFLEPIFIDGLKYSIDFQSTNHYRKLRLNGFESEINIPISYEKQFFDDMLGTKITSTFYLNYIDYSNNFGIYSYDDAKYISNYFNFALYSNLIKKYDNFSHVIHLNLDYTKPSYENINGFFDYFVDLNKKTENINFTFAQLFYNKNGFNFLEHRVNQIYNFSDYKYKYSDLENEIILKFNNFINIYSDILYSFEQKDLSKLQTGLKYETKTFGTSISHTYKKDFSFDNDINYLIANINFFLNKNYKFFGEYNYDFDISYNRQYRLGLDAKFGCWSYKLSYKEETKPSLSSKGASYSRKRGFYIEFNLASIGGIKQEISNDSTSKYIKR